MYKHFTKLITALVGESEGKMFARKSYQNNIDGFLMICVEYIPPCPGRLDKGEIYLLRYEIFHKYAPLRK